MGQRRIEMHISYNGRNFYGLYRIYGLKTVQGELEKVLSGILQEKIRVTVIEGIEPGFSVRIMPVLFDTSCTMDEKSLVRECNYRLEKELRVCSARETKAGYSLPMENMNREYEYRFVSSIYPVIGQEPGIYLEQTELDINAMQEAADLLIGENDFSSFTTGTYEDPYRTIYNIRIEPYDGWVAVRVSGNGFLANMMQMLTGELIRVGRGELEPADIRTRITARTPDPDAPEMPADGLILTRICPAAQYEDVIHNNNESADYYIVRRSLKTDGTVYIVIMRCDNQVFRCLVQHAVRFAFMDGARQVMVIDVQGDRIRAGEKIGSYVPRIAQAVTVSDDLLEFRLYGTWYMMTKQND